MCCVELMDNAKKKQHIFEHGWHPKHQTHWFSLFCDASWGPLEHGGTVSVFCWCQPASAKDWGAHDVCPLKSLVGTSPEMIWNTYWKTWKSHGKPMENWKIMESPWKTRGKRWKTCEGRSNRYDFPWFSKGFPGKISHILNSPTSARGKNCAFANFESWAAAEQCIEEVNGRSLRAGDQTAEGLNVKFADMTLGFFSDFNCFFCWFGLY